VRSGWHALFCNFLVAAVFYGIVLLVVAIVALRFRRMQRQTQVAVLFLCWLLCAMLLVTPLWFPERLLIIGDRYLYILLPPFFMLGVMVVSRIKLIAITRTIIILACMINVTLTAYLANIWQTSTHLTDQLQKTFPADAGGITILLNNPASFKGAPMIGAAPDQEFRLMHNLLYTHPVTGQFPEVLAFNMTSVYDSTAVAIIDDSTVRVSLTSPDSRWYYGTDVAKEYSTAYFSVSLSTDPCCYVLHLRNNADRYRLMYQKEGRWYTVNLNQSTKDALQ
jgi:hypothetical protein